MKPSAGGRCIEGGRPHRQAVGGGGSTVSRCAVAALPAGLDLSVPTCTPSAVTVCSLPQDEPSSGMDPCSKRFLWDAIRQEVRQGCAVVLTSHR